MARTVLVTGASGSLGRAVVKAVSAKGFEVEAATRDLSKIKPTPGVAVVRLDYADPTTFAPALEGAEAVVLMAPPMDPEAPDKLIPFIEKAKTTAVEHVVLISAMGVDQNEQAPLRIIERALMDSGLGYTILRPNFFMENFSTGSIAPMIQQMGGIFLAAGDAKTSFVSTRDIAEVAAVALAEGRTGKEYTLTGPDALDHTEVAARISAAAGREIAYYALDEETMLQGARDNDMPEGAVQYLGVLYAAVRAGYTAAVTPDVAQVTGREATTFDEFVAENAECWR